MVSTPFRQRRRSWAHVIFVLGAVRSVGILSEWRHVRWSRDLRSFELGKGMKWNEPTPPLVLGLLNLHVLNEKELQIFLPSNLSLIIFRSVLLPSNYFTTLFNSLCTRIIITDVIFSPPIYGCNRPTYSLVIMCQNHILWVCAFTYKSCEFELE